MTGMAAKFNANRLSQALQTIRQSPSLHEGLYEALTDNLQWIESPPVPAAGPGLKRLLDMIAEPAIASVDDRMLAVVRSLNEAEIEQIVTELEQLRLVYNR